MRVIEVLQERLVEVKKELVGEKVARHSELRASVDEKVKAGQGSLGAGGRRPGVRVLLCAGTPTATGRRTPPPR